MIEALRDHLLHLFNERRRDGSAVLLLGVWCSSLTSNVSLHWCSLCSLVSQLRRPDIPVQIADRSLGVTNPIATVGQQLLRLLDGRFRVDDVVELLAQPVVAMSFDIEPADVPVSANPRHGKCSLGP